MTYSAVHNLSRHVTLEGRARDRANLPELALAVYVDDDRAGASDADPPL